ncbi:MAG: sigma-70 family RNA polymerase sigma factor [Clostridia bacterium]|nr:sigma-70 family RNA polymerase sigma factor [Clostridia bacterium]
MSEKNEITALLAEIKENHADAFALLVARYSPLLHHCLGEFNLHDYYDEAFAEGQMALLRAALAYDSARSPIVFGSYAKTCIRNALIDLKKRKDKDSQLCSYEELTESGSLDVSDESSDGGVSTRLIDAESLKELHRKIAACLSPYERKIFNYYVEGYSPVGIAKKLGESEKSVQNAIYRFTQKLRRILLP